MSDSTILTADETAGELAGTAFEYAGDHLVATFDTGDFLGAVRVLDTVAPVAEEMNHHPDVRLGYGSITFLVSSHDVGGVTARDLQLARRIQEIVDAA